MKPAWWSIVAALVSVMQVLLLPVDPAAFCNVLARFLSPGNAATTKAAHNDEDETEPQEIAVPTLSARRTHLKRLPEDTLTLAALRIRSGQRLLKLYARPASHHGFRYGEGAPLRC